MIETMGLTESCAPILSNPLPPKKIKYITCSPLPNAPPTSTQPILTNAAKRTRLVLKNNNDLKEEDLINHCRNFLGEFKSPDKIYFFTELPKGSSGKIQRLKIKDKIETIKN